MNVTDFACRRSIGFRLSLTLSCALAFAGCKSNQPAPIQNAQPPVQQAQQQAPQPQAPGQYVSAPGGQSAGTAPPAYQQPAKPAPSAVASTQSSPLPPPPPPPPSAPAGTAITFRTNEAISSTRNQLGDRFTGSLSRAIISRGETVFPAGTPVAGTIIALNRKGRFKGPGDLGVVLVEVGGHRVETSEYERVVKGRGGRSAGFIAGGAGLGALIGGLAGHGKGALIGGLSGAGAGTAIAATGNRSVSLPAESVITVRLSTELTR